MIQGTTSDAGKSTIVAGLCRILKRRGISVAPFKPQNMALNSAVTNDNGEIGRAQAFQALAAGIEPHTDMNPVLLKPNSDTGAQIIIQGQAIGSMSATDYHQYKKVAKTAVLESYQRLSEQYDVILVEGAGSPAEINLRENDIANMGFAEAVDCPVWIVADIDRGGVFAHLAGTLSLLSPSEQQRVSAFLINRFRGDFAILKPGIDWLENHTAVKTVGTIPYLHGIHLEAEDSLSQKSSLASDKNKSLNVIVPRLPRMSNHTDFDPLLLHPQINLQFISQDEDIPAADLIILPGSKSVVSDLSWLRAQGWEEAINKHLRYGGKLLGICGGFQMLGKTLLDPNGIESKILHSDGLCLLDFSTTLGTQKQLRNVSGTLALGTLALGNSTVSGYEIHAGISSGKALTRPAVFLDTKKIDTGAGAGKEKEKEKEKEMETDGAISEDNQIMGTYLHGLFETDSACQAILDWAGLKDAAPLKYRDQREEHIDRLADAMEQHLDMDFLLSCLGIPDHPQRLRQKQ